MRKDREDRILYTFNYTCINNCPKSNCSFWKDTRYKIICEKPLDLQEGFTL